jgi:4a-hydroxytetrahydrobiopterin dehydratase
MAKLTGTQIKMELASTAKWKKKGNAIQRIVVLKDFAAAMKFVNAVARAAEKADHHPDIDIRWNKVTLSLSTHSAGGLTENDFEMARKINRLA